MAQTKANMDYIIVFLTFNKIYRKNGNKKIIDTSLVHNLNLLT